MGMGTPGLHMCIHTGYVCVCVCVCVGGVVWLGHGGVSERKKEVWVCMCLNSCIFFFFFCQAHHCGAFIQKHSSCIFNLCLN